MIGLSSLLKPECQSKFVLILAEEQPALYTSDYLSTIVQNQSSNSENSVSVISFVYNNLETLANIRVYDYVKKPYTTLDALFSDLKGSAKSVKRNTLILDDLGLFSAWNGRTSDRIYNFFKQISKLYSQIVVCCTVSTVSREEISLLCNLTEHVVILKNPNEGEQRFPCNVLILKPSGKTMLEQTFVEFENGNVVEVQKKSEDLSRPSGPADDIMRNLTTFKLTIEENEKESKNRLYLPYLDAQRAAVPDPLEEFYDDDDEEDEDD